MEKIYWVLKSYSDITKDQLFDIYILRQEVFVVEQFCPYQDADLQDKYSYHLMGYNGNFLVAYLRIVPPNLSSNTPMIGRVVVQKLYRGKGLGREVMKKAVMEVHKIFGKVDINISAQEYLISFYESLQFKIIGESYLEDGIPHICMVHKS
tara:strand:- start:104 stop:556 length:453 start_codon:yes stop_codon:yes gene_type:complete